MKYVAIISSAHKRVVDPFIQETYEKFKQFVPKGFEHLAKYDYCLEIPLYYESPEYYELIDYLNQHNEKPQVPMLYTSYTKSELNKAEFFRLAPSDSPLPSRKLPSDTDKDSLRSGSFLPPHRYSEDRALPESVDGRYGNQTFE